MSRKVLAIERDEVAIRPARLTDLQACRVIEDDAGQIFFDIDMAEVDEDPPRCLEDLQRAFENGLLWVADDRNGVPVGFALTELVDSNVHLSELGVVTAMQRQGVGARLIEVIAENARRNGHAKMTLTTFRDVAWNAPYYARLGFTVQEPSSFSPGMKQVFESKKAHGLNVQDRVAMVRTL
ncbi:MAG: GNAT family N-acetyltransferase [Alphaproteobacteria bacterium]|nr:GNAT family N-acetyltransferase [Rhodospirillaceae bacterium]MDG2482395.1 GNAT family N-acetyltransferase [Alphaproteobacteria bacterium]MBT6202194.1 GNAT family N-acetyltransferase [Rhodospirillaceae bacterium]MBT6511642.1 GNAT family N-acetyltransferase [Rhodospirillaceae bacterium]MBT7614314.1 GNAT family N-acetyltransferase [Rhodospirillaceae bacterium]